MQNVFPPHNPRKTERGFRTAKRSRCFFRKNEGRIVLSLPSRCDFYVFVAPPKTAVVLSQLSLSLEQHDHAPVSCHLGQLLLEQAIPRLESSSSLLAKMSDDSYIMSDDGDDSEFEVLRQFLDGTSRRPRLSSCKKVMNPKIRDSDSVAPAVPVAVPETGTTNCGRPQARKRSRSRRSRRQETGTCGEGKNTGIASLTRSADSTGLSASISPSRPCGNRIFLLDDNLRVLRQCSRQLSPQERERIKLVWVPLKGREDGDYYGEGAEPAVPERDKNHVDYILRR
ncbi:unnamed protein product [Amoebophrya sp. A120]|nr:unnamed protein product [Amoebophrya sp. A120]|eukprot:GSA120T00009011001.1